VKYTTLEQLAQKLRGRLSILSNSVPNTPYPINNPTTPVDPLLIEDVAREKEAYVDIILSNLYVLPLRNNHIIITEIVEALIVSDLVSFSYWDNTTSMPTDVTMGLKTHANNLLSMLTAGLNFQIPGLITSVVSPGMMVPKRIELPGEIPVSQAQTRVLINNDTVVRKSLRSYEPNDFTDNRFNRGVALGANADYYHNYNAALTDPNLRVLGNNELSLDNDNYPLVNPYYLDKLDDN
jgi:hypothetical protein